MNFKNLLDEKRKKVAIALINSYIMIATLTLLFNMLNNLSHAEITRTQLIYMLLNFLLVALLLWLRVFLVERNYFLIVNFINFSALGLVTALLLSNGTGNALAYLVTVVSILSTSIVLGVRAGVMITVTYSLINISVLIMHSYELVNYVPDHTASTIVDSLIGITLLGFITYVIYLGFSQIEESYSKAYEYARQLETLNQSLDGEVNLRTKQLRESFEHQISSLYSTATIGRIAKSMLHDIATPLSTLKGGYSLLQQTDDPEEREHLLELADKAVSQIGRIVSNAQSLIHNETPNEWFYPKRIVENALIITKHELRDLGINVEMQIDSDARLFGVTGIFERIVLNLVTNASDELKLTEKPRKKILINGYSQGRLFILEVSDNGRGIKEEYIAKIFEPEFTSKSNSGSNLGMGLHFVKTSMEKFFGGEVEVETEEGKGTKFKLVFETDD